MAVQVCCPKGHSYIQADVYAAYPPGAPRCPECYKEWEKGKMTKRQWAEQFREYSHVCLENMDKFEDEKSKAYWEGRATAFMAAATMLERDVPLEKEDVA